jgi:hypothetical protein
VRPSRLAACAAASLLLVGLLAAPVAASTVHTVDDDGLAGPGGCAGAATVPSTIQAALDAAEPGDTIRVCPGVYTEQLRVATRGVTVRAIQPWKAVVRPPEGPLAGSPPNLVTITADGVTLQWLRLQAATTGDCVRLGAVVRVGSTAQDALLRSLRIGAAGDGDAQFGPCGFQAGIRVVGSGQARVGTTMVRNFQTQGIVSGPAARVDIATSSIRFDHRGTTCVSGPACLRRVADVAERDGVVIEGAGSIRGSTVVGASAVVPDSIAQLDTGIVIRTSGVASGNLVKGASTAILLEGAGRVVQNVIEQEGGGIAGITVTGQGGLIRENLQADAIVWGIGATTTSSDNRFVRNVAYDNETVDCRDETGTTAPAGVSNPIKNTWIGNVGHSDDPDGICQPPS